MPYIPPEDRKVLDSGERKPATVGELNYVITRQVIDYLDGQISYDTINAVVGCLESVKVEMNRRFTAPYEDSKVRQNGDVWPSPEALQ